MQIFTNKHFLLLLAFAWASWYGGNDGFAWKTMANGAPMNPAAMTCASWYYPLGTRLKVTAVKNGRSVVVVVCDKRGIHDIDLSKGSFEKIANLRTGIIEVNIKILK